MNQTEQPQFLEDIGGVHTPEDAIAAIGFVSEGLRDDTGVTSVGGEFDKLAAAQAAVAYIESSQFGFTDRVARALAKLRSLLPPLPNEDIIKNDTSINRSALLKTVIAQSPDSRVEILQQATKLESIEAAKHLKIPKSIKELQGYRVKIPGQKGVFEIFDMSETFEEQARGIDQPSLANRTTLINKLGQCMVAKDEESNSHLKSRRSSSDPMIKPLKIWEGKPGALMEVRKGGKEHDRLYCWVSDVNNDLVTTVLLVGANGGGMDEQVRYLNTVVK